MPFVLIRRTVPTLTAKALPNFVNLARLFVLYIVSNVSVFDYNPKVVKAHQKQATNKKISWSLDIMEE